MTTTVLPPQACLACGHVMDRHAHMSVTGSPKDIATPKPGDVTLCIRCGCVMFYDDHLHFRMPTADEYLEIAQDERVQKGIISIQQLNNAKKQ